MISEGPDHRLIETSEVPTVPERLTMLRKICPRVS